MSGTPVLVKQAYKKENYTENSNGIFFDLSTISESTVLQINDYLNFCLKTRQEDKLRLNELETIRIQNVNYVETFA